jgi:LPS export ABC transporter protein LptC
MPNRFPTFAHCLLLGLILLSGASCDSDKNLKPERSSLGDSARRPDSELGGAQISLYDGKNVTTGIRADKILKFEAQDSAVAYHLNIQFYDSSGHTVSDLVGDSGIVREGKGLFEIYGNVVATSDDKGTRLETDYLKWNPQINLIQTDSFVKITKGSDVITGWGLETDRRLSRVKILRQVSGSVSESTSLR